MTINGIPVKATQADELTDAIAVTHACPQCGGRLQLVLDGQVGVPYVQPYFTVGQSAIEYRMEDRPFVACSSCEFCAEVEQ